MPESVSDEFLARAPIGIAILRLDDPPDPRSLRILKLNAAAARLADMPLTDAVGTRVGDRFPEILNAGVAEQLAAVVRGSDAVDLGDIPGVYDPARTYAVKAFPLSDNGVGVLFEDVRERRAVVRALQESEERFRKIFEASPGAICVFAADSGELLDVNPRFAELLGYRSRSAVVGKHVAEFGMWPAPGEYAGLLDELRRAGSIREATVVYRTSGGQVRRALVALELIEIDRHQQVLGLFWRV